MVVGSNPGRAVLSGNNLRHSTSRLQWSSGGVLGCGVTKRRECIYRDSHCDTQSWGWAAAPFLQCLDRLSLLPSVGS